MGGVRPDTNQRPSPQGQPRAWASQSQGDGEGKAGELGRALAKVAKTLRLEGALWVGTPPPLPMTGALPAPPPREG